MAKFSERSLANLLSCDRRLQDVFHEVIKHFDCTVICGHRSDEEQEKAFNEGNSKARPGQSPHNEYPSMAADVLPYPIDWENTERMTYFAGQVIATARELGIDLTWGKDWDGDTDLHDNTLNDYPHFEITGWRDLAPEEVSITPPEKPEQPAEAPPSENLFSVLLRLLRQLFSSN